MSRNLQLCFLFIVTIGCNKETNIYSLNQNSLLTTQTWMIQKSSGIGGGYSFTFDRTSGSDPFQFSKVRIKLDPNGTVTGIDNNENPIKGATWKYDDATKKLEIAGSNVFGIDGTLDVITLQSDKVEIKNVVKIPQISSNIDLKATLVPAK